MRVMILRDGQQYGPYNEQQLQQHIRDGVISKTDLAWTEGQFDWLPIQSVLDPIARSGNLCPQCKGPLLLQVENPQRSTGIIVIVLGILLAPFCVGIILLVWGWSLSSETRRTWHCRGCGRMFAA